MDGKNKKRTPKARVPEKTTVKPVSHYDFLGEQADDNETNTRPPTGASKGIFNPDAKLPFNDGDGEDDE